jgi:hypothetical protein
MFNLYFGSVISILTTVFILALLAFIAVSILQRHKISRWGRLILIFILAGTAVSAFSATRDAFMLENALFAPMSIQSLICSIAGGLIFLTGLVSIFVKKQSFRRFSFHLISLLFLAQVISVEFSRAILL